MAARRRKVRLSPFPPDGENCARSLAPPLPGEPAALGFAGRDGSGWTLRVHIRLSPDPVYGGYPSGWAMPFRRAKFEWLSAIPAGPPGPGFAKFAAGAVPLPRLALPSKRSRCWIRRRDGCPHPPASLSLPPITVAPPLGGQCPSGAQNLSGFPRFPPGHRALGLQKLPLVRFHFRAWLCRANVPGPGYAVGAGALTRPPFP